jgi:hypothetical protein
MSIPASISSYGVYNHASIKPMTSIRHFMTPATCQADSKDPEKPILSYQDIMGEILNSEFTVDLTDVPEDKKNKVDFPLKSRDEHMKDLMNPSTTYDLLIVGGGANGTGVALDAASRGLKVAVIDKYDFASGTSCKSTKMAHGGIRYFE